MVRALIEDGHDVLAIDHNSEQPDLDGVQCVRADVADIQLIRGVFELSTPEAVIHLAANASVPFSLKNAYEDCRTNVLGTVAMISAAQQVNCSRFVFASTCALYDPESIIPLREDMDSRPASPYGVGKLACEYYLAASGLSWAALRYGNVYGPGQKSSGENAVVSRIINHMLKGDELIINGDGEQTRDWIYVGDVIRANMIALTHSRKSGIWNIATGIGTSLNEAVAIVQNITGHDDEVPHGPPVPEQRHIVLDPSKANKDLDWEPGMTLRAGLAHTIVHWSLD
jgi:UDP-glucose 4-epimerase